VGVKATLNPIVEKEGDKKIDVIIESFLRIEGQEKTHFSKHSYFPLSLFIRLAGYRWALGMEVEDKIDSIIPSYPRLRSYLAALQCLFLLHQDQNSFAFPHPSSNATPPHPLTLSYTLRLLF
jgi:hypothetical protein